MRGWRADAGRKAGSARQLVSTAVGPCNKHASVRAGQGDIWVACPGAHTLWYHEILFIHLCTRAGGHTWLGGQGGGAHAGNVDESLTFVHPSDESCEADLTGML